MNFSIFPLASVIETIISEYGDYNKALEFAKTVEDSIQKEEIAFFANYRIAQLLDEGNGSREQVISSYEKVSGQEKGFWDPINRRKIGSSVARKRIKQIKIYKIEEAIVVGENVILKPGLRSKVKSFRSISKGTQVKIIYKDRELIELDGKVGNWAKIMLPDGKIGWMFDGFLSPTSRKPIFSTLKNKEQIWCMEGANFNRTSTIYAKKIKEPTLIKIIPNITSREVVFSDINDDNILDIFANSPKGLVAIDGVTHKVIWSFECRKGSIPLIKNNIVYVIGFVDNQGYIFALDKTTFELLWKISVGNRRFAFPPSSPAANDTMIYVGSFEGLIIAINIKSGNVEWKFESSYPIVNTIALSNNVVYFCSREVTSGNNIIFALDALTGKIKWKYEISSKAYRYIPGVCIEKGRLFCNGTNGYLYALNAKTGKLLWQIEITMSPRHSIWFRPSIRKGILYCSTPEREVLAIDAKTGKVKWRYVSGYKSQHNIVSRPTVVSNELYIRTADSNIHAVSLKNGELMWKFETGKRSHGGIFNPSIAQGIIFVGSTDGNTYVIGEGAEETKSLHTSMGIKIGLLIAIISVVIIIGVYFLIKRRGSD